MKIIALFCLLGFAMTTNAQAADVSILISGFDPFGGSRHNNSQIVGKKLVESLQKRFPNYQFKFCQLRTVYDKAQEELMDCYHSMDTKPKFIISIGEGSHSKNIFLETRGHNLDDAALADNDGVVRRNQTISFDHPLEVGSRLDWSRAYCKLNQVTKSLISLSNDPGNFVCNNTIFKMSAFIEDISFGFIHIPAYTNIFTNNAKVNRSSKIISELIVNLIEGAEQKLTSLPASRSEIEYLLESTNNSCDREFYQKLITRY